MGNTKYYTTQEAAEKLGVSKRRVVQLAKKLGCIWFGSSLMVPASAVAKRLRNHPGRVPYTKSAKSSATS